MFGTYYCVYQGFESQWQIEHVPWDGWGEITPHKGVAISRYLECRHDCFYIIILIVDVVVGMY